MNDEIELVEEVSEKISEKDCEMHCELHNDYIQQKQDRSWLLSPCMLGLTSTCCARLVLTLHLIVALLEILACFVADSLRNYRSIGMLFVNDIIRVLGEGAIIMIIMSFFILLLIASLGLQIRQSLLVLPFLAILIISLVAYPFMLYRFAGKAARVLQIRPGSWEIMETIAVSTNLLLLILLSFQSSRILLRAMIDMEDEKTKERPELCSLALYLTLFS